MDALKMVFRVPEDKLQRFLAEANRLLQLPKPTPRELARIAGQLLSFTPAVDLAPLLARGLFHLLKGRAGWDCGFDTSADLLATLRWCVEAVPLYNGTRMLRRGAALQLQLAGDASEVSAARGQMGCVAWGSAACSAWHSVHAPYNVLGREEQAQFVAC